jgi:hypothetical protein
MVLYNGISFLRKIFETFFLRSVNFGAPYPPTSQLGYRNALLPLVGTGQHGLLVLLVEGTRVVLNSSGNNKKKQKTKKYLK